MLAIPQRHFAGYLFKPAILVALTLGAIIVAVAGINQTRADSTKADHLREINEWHEARIERLHKPTGWLTLAGLMPMEEGENRFGSAADNGIVFPDRAPDYAGVFTLKVGSVSIIVEDNVEITSENTPVRAMTLDTDADEKATVLEMGSFRFYVIERSGKYYIRLKDRESEVLANFKGIDRFPVDIEWRIEGRFELYDPPKKIMVPNALGYETETPCYGAISFEVDGNVYKLEPMGQPSEGFFIVFGDATSGVETYGGGRFLSASPPDPAGITVLDFNKAYNPPCAFTRFATCPLPHVDNLLEVRIEAGEKKFEGGSGH